jgi:hypothetical protein
LLQADVELTRSSTSTGIVPARRPTPSPLPAGTRAEMSKGDRWAPSDVPPRRLPDRTPVSNVSSGGSERTHRPAQSAKHGGGKEVCASGCVGTVPRTCVLAPSDVI